MARHKYLFKEGMRLAFLDEIDVEVFDVTVYHEGWTYEKKYTSFLILDGVDELSQEERAMFDQALEVFEVKQEY